MFSYFKGILVDFNTAQATLEVNGIGYLINIPCSALTQLPPIGQNLQLYTSFVIREFSHAIYGFITAQERDLFDVLLNVSGIGPKLALSLIGHMNLDNLYEAITNQNLTLLCKVPGVGKKTAERLVVELRDKLTNLIGTKASNYSIHLQRDPQMQKMNDAVLALVNLGYNHSAAQKAVKQSLKDLSDECDIATLITFSLKTIS